MSKKQHGQFFTTNNPFVLKSFKEWFSLLPKDARLLEPFAGSNNLIKMIDMVFGEKQWGSFDIQPPKNNFTKVKTVKLDTIENMPEGFSAVITNPPYLARNSATRSGIQFHKDNKYDDLYKFCLEKILEKYDFVSVIIPESFITSNQFRNKLFSVISLTQSMFEDTDCPVCIANFVPTKIKQKKLKDNDFYLYQLDKLIGKFSEIDNFYHKNILLNLPEQKIRFYFNDKDGKIGLWGVDNTLQDSICFGDGEKISPQTIKISSRAITRISCDFDLSEKEINKIIIEANKILNEFRKNTNDVFLTSFKGLRKDGKYRRRLDFKMAEQILNVASKNVLNNKLFLQPTMFQFLTTS